jgi:hypothetical protein
MLAAKLFRVRRLSGVHGLQAGVKNGLEPLFPSRGFVAVGGHPSPRFVLAKPPRQFSPWTRDRPKANTQAIRSDSSGSPAPPYYRHHQCGISAHEKGFSRNSVSDKPAAPHERTAIVIGWTVHLYHPLHRLVGI